MANAVRWFALLSLLFGLLTLGFLPFFGLTVVFSCLMIVAVLIKGQDDLHDHITAIAQAHFARQDQLNQLNSPK